MKFKTPQFEALYTDALTLIKTNKIKDALSSLETLLLLLKEKRENKENILHVTRLLQALQSDEPTLGQNLIEQLEREKKTKAASSQALEKEIDTIENNANDLYNMNDFFNAAIYYGYVVAKTQGKAKFAPNYADACWSQGACYESIAASLKATQPQDALRYVDKAIYAVKRALAAYLPLNANDDIDACTQKLKFLKEQQSLLKEVEPTCSLLITLKMKITQTTSPANAANVIDSLDVLASTALNSGSIPAFKGYRKSILERIQAEKSQLSQSSEKTALKRSQ